MKKTYFYALFLSLISIANFKLSAEESNIQNSGLEEAAPAQEKVEVENSEQQAEGVEKTEQKEEVLQEEQSWSEKIGEEFEKVEEIAQNISTQVQSQAEVISEKISDAVEAASESAEHASSCISDYLSSLANQFSQKINCVLATVSELFSNNISAFFGSEKGQALQSCSSYNISQNENCLVFSLPSSCSSNSTENVCLSLVENTLQVQNRVQAGQEHCVVVTYKIPVPEGIEITTENAVVRIEENGTISISCQIVNQDASRSYEELSLESGAVSVSLYLRR